MNYKVTISMPEMMLRYMQNKVRKGGYGTVSEYIRELIRLDQRIEFAREDAAHARRADLTHVWHPNEIIDRGA